MADDPVNTVDTGQRDARGRFRPGNPGRKHGSMNKATMAARKLLAEAADELIHKAIAMALAGDGIALKLCIERLVPPARHEVSLKGVELPAMTAARDLPLLTAAILRAALDGKIALADVPAVLKIVEVTSQAISVGDHDERLAALERLITERRLHHAA
jgi:hypothetical protein